MPDFEPPDAWPDLPLDAWKDTRDTIHMLTQVAGKLRLARTPLLNHWWNTTLMVTPRGLGTGTIPHHGGAFQIDFDLLEHRILVTTSGPGAGAVPLRARPVAETYGELMAVLADLGIAVPIGTRPVEVEHPIPFENDRVHSAYDPVYAARFARVLLQTTRVLQVFRARFLGKSSPVHFFWGSFDLAVTRFSGRLAPPHPGGIPNISDRVVREAYSHEVSSAGWWPGGGAVAEPAFYAYAYPEPPGFARSPAGPAEAYYHAELREFVLPYDAVRRAPDPDRALLEFLQSTYEAAAGPGGWDRAALERAT